MTAIADTYFRTFNSRTRLWEIRRLQKRSFGQLLYTMQSDRQSDRLLFNMNRDAAIRAAAQTAVKTLEGWGHHSGDMVEEVSANIFALSAT